MKTNSRHNATKYQAPIVICTRCEGRAVYLEKGIRKAPGCNSGDVTNCGSYTPVLPIMLQEDRFKVASLFEDVKLVELTIKSKGRKPSKIGLYTPFSIKEKKEMEELNSNESA